ncbi:glycosyltransferase [Nocardia sp. NPDC058705]|uniref:glycosyltransferase n=1 Tax=Nocardia sp. NPDC058705 TaxID=3346609 RepID=UPI0036CDFDF0
MHVEAPPPRTRATHLVHGENSRKVSRKAMLGLLIGALGSVAVCYLLVDDLRVFLIVAGVTFSVFAMVMSCSFLVSLVYMHRESGLEGQLLLAEPDGPAREAIAVLIPARHETDVLAHTLLNTAWTQRDHPAHRVVTVINDDDPETCAVAATTAHIVNEGFARGHGYDRIRRDLDEALRFAPARTHETPGPVQLLIYPLRDRPPNKPQQLNYAFWQLRDQFTVFTILDAESLAAPGLLCAVDQAFQDNPEVEIIQGGIQLMDPQITGTFWRRAGQRLHRWYAWHNLLEYTRWFSSQMRYQSDRGFMPLGGNTVFLRAELLAKSGGWPMSLTEDCELGIRATAVHRARTLTFYDPRLTTREETPPSLLTLVKQRRRWNIGFLQSLVAGNWRSLPTVRSRMVAVWILSMSLFQTISLAILPLTLITLFWIKSPAPLAVAVCLPTIPIVLGIALQLLQIREYGRIYARRVPWHVYPLFVVTFYPYQLVLSFAALQAVVWYAMGKLGWDKTAHVGDHFDLAPALSRTA